MATTFVGSGSNSGTGTVASVTLPSGISQGDTIVIWVAKQDDADPVTGPVGFARWHAASTSSGNDRWMFCYIKSADGTESNETVEAFWPTHSRAWWCVAAVLSPGAGERLDPEPANGDDSNISTVDNDPTPTCPDVTPSQDGAFIFNVTMLYDASVTANPTTDNGSATNVASFFDIANTLSGRVDYEEQATAGLYSGATHTYPDGGAGGDAIVHTIAFTPVAGTEAARVSQARAEAIISELDGNAVDVRVSQARAEAVLAATDPKNKPFVRVSTARIEIVEVLQFRDVVIYTDDTLDSVVGNWKSFFQDNLGYTTTVRDDANLGTDSDLDQFATIMVISSAVGIGSTARSQAETYGTPLLIVPRTETFAEGEAKTTAATEADLAGTFEYVDNSPGVTQVDILDNEHFITSVFATGLLTITSAADATHVLDDGEAIVGEVLADGDSAHANLVAGQAVLTAIEIGTTDQATPTAAETTVRIVVLGQPYDVSLVNSDGSTLVERVMQWLIGTAPDKPSILDVIETASSAEVQWRPYNHALGVAEQFSRVKIVTDGGDPDTAGDVVADSGNIGPGLTSWTSGAVLDDNTPYDVYLDVWDVNDESRRSDKFDFTTLALTKVGGLLVEFLESDGSTVVESYEMVTESETYVKLLLEALERPVDAQFLRLTPYKKGTAAKAGFAKNPTVNKGSSAGSYSPKPFYPELDEYYDHGSTTASETIDWSKGRVQRVLLDKNSTLTFINLPSAGEIQLLVVQDNTGTRTLALPTEVVGEPTFSSGADQVDHITMLVVDSSTIYVVGEKLNIS